MAFAFADETTYASLKLPFFKESIEAYLITVEQSTRKVWHFVWQAG